jgi:hypothetical protein
MHRNYQRVKCLALTIAAALEMSGVALAENAIDQDQTNPDRESELLSYQQL